MIVSRCQLMSAHIYTISIFELNQNKLMIVVFEYCHNIDDRLKRHYILLNFN